MKKALYMFALVLNVAAALLSATGCKRQRARDELDKGVQAYKAEDYEKAIAHFRNAASYDKDLKAAKLYLATTYMQQYVPGVDTPENDTYGRRAIEQYKTVLADDPRNITGLKGLAGLYVNMKKFDDGREYYKRAIAADPNDPEAYYLLAVADWTAVYKDISARKATVGLHVEDLLKKRQICEEIKATDGPVIDEAINMLESAMQKRQGYDDAMTYTKLLYQRRADTECGNPEAYANDIKTARFWEDKATAAVQKKAEEAANKAKADTALEERKK